MRVGVWVVLLCLILVSAAGSSVSDLANGWTYQHENGAVLLTWERPSGMWASLVLGCEIWRNFGLRDIILIDQNEWQLAYDVDSSEPLGIQVVELEINSITGGISSIFRDFIPWLPDADGNPTWNEFLNDNQDVLGVYLTDTFVHYGWVPSGPEIGNLYYYQMRPILVGQCIYPGWYLYLGELSYWSGVIPVGPPVPIGKEVTGTMATFEFNSTFGTDETILQVAHDPGVGSLVSYFLPENTHSQIQSPLDPTDPEGNHVTVTVDLSQVPGSGDFFWWRVGSRNRRSADWPRPWPATPGYSAGSPADPDYGWVWSDPQWLVVGGFYDVPMTSWAYQEIEALWRSGIATGYPDGTYRPFMPVSRDQMAVYIARALAAGDANVPSDSAYPVPSFTDVPADHWAYNYIEYAKAQGIVQGYPDGTYHPEYSVTRDQMAVFVARAVVDPSDRPDLPSYVPPATPSFPDVPTAFWSYRYIEYCRENDVVSGFGDGLYHPEGIASRDQMAVYVVRAFNLET